MLSQENKDLLKIIQDSTKSSHRRLEQTSASKNLMKSDVRLSDVEFFIQKFYLSTFRFSNQIPSPHLPALINDFLQKKMSRLEKDLRNLKGENFSPNLNLPLNKKEKKIEIYAWSYIVIGSELGNHFVSRHLSQHLKTEMSNLSFFETNPPPFEEMLNILNSLDEVDQLHFVDELQKAYQIFIQEFSS